jgi:dephospho-CoA kinase
MSVNNEAHVMKWFGLTGGIATGKSTVTKMLREQGYSVIDADELAKKAVSKHSPGLRSIVEKFGETVLTAEGELDRKKLGQIVFADKNKLLQLEDMVHPFVQAEVEKQKEMLILQGYTLAFYDVPLLFEKNMFSQFDGIVLVCSPEELQKQRMNSRDRLSVDEINKRLSAQMNIREKEKIALNDKSKNIFIVRNDGDLDQLRQELKKTLALIGG